MPMPASNRLERLCAGEQPTARKLGSERLPMMKADSCRVEDIP
jgi:hypothetical protein